MLCGCLAAVGAVSAQRVRAEDENNPARNKLPQPGDLLVPFGEDNAQPLKPADIKPASDPVLAWAFDPKEHVARDGSRLNLILVMRFDPSSLSADERPRAAGGIVAYSAVCTHQQCWVTDWLTARQILQCPCHQSEYDPRRGAQVVGGPAPRPLPALPLKIADERLEVAAPFTDRVGGEKPSG